METMPPHIFQKRNAKTAACTPRFLQQEKRRKEKMKKKKEEINIMKTASWAGVVCYGIIISIRY